MIRTGGFTGSILINGEPQELESFKKHSCYIMQEDQLYEQLTVREAMEFASKLKYSTLSINPQKHKMVNILTCHDHLSNQLLKTHIYM